MSTDMTIEQAQAMLEDMDLNPDDWKAYAKRSEPEKLALGVFILHLTMQGKSLRKIESETGIPRMTVSRYRQKALESIALPTVTEARVLEIERLEALIEAVWDRALTGDEKAIASYVKLSDRMGKITGTDKPIQVESTVVEVTAQERELQQLLDQAERDAAMQEQELIPND